MVAKHIFSIESGWKVHTVGFDVEQFDIHSWLKYSLLVQLGRMAGLSQLLAIEVIRRYKNNYKIK